MADRLLQVPKQPVHPVLYRSGSWKIPLVEPGLANTGMRRRVSHSAATALGTRPRGGAAPPSVRAGWRWRDERAGILELRVLAVEGIYVRVVRRASSHFIAISTRPGCCGSIVGSRASMTPSSTRPASRSAATKFVSFSRYAHSLATQRSSLSKHQPVNWRSVPGAAVLMFWTLTRRSRHPEGSIEVVRSTPSMLKPCSPSNGDNSPATPSISSAKRAVSSSSSAIGRTSTSSDIVALRGSRPRRTCPESPASPPR